MFSNMRVVKRITYFKKRSFIRLFACLFVRLFVCLFASAIENGLRSVKTARFPCVYFFDGAKFKFFQHVKLYD